MGDYYCDRDQCINHFLGNYNTILDTKTLISHDGYDAYGPESDLFDLYVLYLKDNEIFLDNYHRENWFDGMNEEYSLYKTKNISNILKDKSYIKKLLPTIFIEEISEKIYYHFSRKIYNPSQVRFNKINEEKYGVLQIPGYPMGIRLFPPAGLFVNLNKRIQIN